MTEFITRHIGPSESDLSEMLKVIGSDSLESFINEAVPNQIRSNEKLELTDFPEALSEEAALERIKKLAAKNVISRSYIGMGYNDCFTPTVIQRNILENPGWYTQYTPYQAEISQGRLEALLNFQTLITELTGLPIANASLLDEGTAAAEAMVLSLSVAKRKKLSGKCYFIADNLHPQTIEVLRTRAAGLDIELVEGNAKDAKLDEKFFGALVQYPGTDGEIFNPSNVETQIHKIGGLLTISADPLALMLLKSPAELGADIALGNTQRFGIPLGFGGPHAAYFAVKEELARLIPGRIVGVSKDRHGKNALRLALQTREQHIRREKATSNICTAQVLLAIMAGMYAVYHGPKGLKRIAKRVNDLTSRLAEELCKKGYTPVAGSFFDTVCLSLEPQTLDTIRKAAESKKINLRYFGNTKLSISLDETVSEAELNDILELFPASSGTGSKVSGIPSELIRADQLLLQEVFDRYHSETEFLRYVRKLESRDLSLGASMIPLGSCTMKLNATTEMLPLSWPEFGSLHPFAPADESLGYKELFKQLETALAEITGFDAISLQPNSGAQGEYAGLMTIRNYHISNGDTHKDICLIPTSAHGTNPASAIMAGMQVVVVACDENGNVDLTDLAEKVDKHKENLAALMITYPSTHGVFEEGVIEACELVHAAGGQVYLDGANLNALVGLSKPAMFGTDVCHINLHKTFCIPHGGGGPGMGPIGVKKHLEEFLPGHSCVDLPGKTGAVSAAPWGSASILTISWMYLCLTAGEGLRKATEVALLNANYIASRLKDFYPILYTGKNERVAHECILDLRHLKKSAGVEVEDVAKRLIDYGFHAPTISWPVPGTMMVEPTESESKEELDRFCDAMIAIREEIAAIERGEMDRELNPLKRAPHTASDLIEEQWDFQYTREQAIFPTAFTKDFKFWPAVSRVDNAYGDRNLFCTCG